ILRKGPPRPGHSLVCAGLWLQPLVAGRSVGDHCARAGVGPGDPPPLSQPWELRLPGGKPQTPVPSSELQGLQVQAFCPDRRGATRGQQNPGPALLAAGATSQYLGSQSCHPPA
ncbi:hypothetical protein P7K49_015196, partial [Saguinus oedipus]